MTNNVVRSVRNNNPGNIRCGDPWQGLARVQSDEQFCVFTSPKWGFRALARTLITYFDRHDCRTIRTIIRRWAPPIENNTQAYIDNVCRIAGFDGNDPLDLHSYEHVAPLVRAISIHEAGGWFFQERDLDEGLRLAGIEPPIKPLSESRTMKAVAAGGTASIGIASIGEAVREIDPALDLVTRIAGVWPFLACVLLLTALGAVAYFRYDDWRELRR